MPMTFCTIRNFGLCLILMLCIGLVLLYRPYNFLITQTIQMGSVPVLDNHHTAFPTKQTNLKDQTDVLPTWEPPDKERVKKIKGYKLPKEVMSIKKRVLKYDNCTRVRHHNITDSVLNGLNITFYSYSKVNDTLLKMTKTEQTKLRPFLPILDLDSKRALVRAYMVLKEELDRLNVDNVMFHGSLLGLHRFSGLMPWDDDIDIGIMYKDLPKVREALSCVEGHELMVDSNMRWSFFPSNGKPSSTMPPKKYPFIDIFFLSNDTEYIWPMNKWAKPKGIFRMEHWFPLRHGAYEGIKVSVPRVPEFVLKTVFHNLDQCKSQESGHLHKLKSKEKFEVACSKLFPLYGHFPRQKFI